MISANRRSGIRPGPGDGSEILQRSTDCQAKRNVLILRAVLAAGRRWPDSARERPQAFRALAPRGSASVPARESLARVLPVGPGRRFSARDPASPGVACSTLVPRRALLASARAVRYAPSESVPRGTQAVSLKLAAPLQPESQYPMATTARRLVSRHPSQYPEAHGPSVPRARLDGAQPRRSHPTFKPSRATSVPASGPPGPQPSESQRVRGGHPTPSVAGLRPALSQAPSTAPQRPPEYRSQPRPAPPPLGAAALANTSIL